MSEEQKNGLDTIKDFDGVMPAEVGIPYTVMKKQQLLMQGWNACYIAIIPYCFKCKVPLVWHTYPEGNTLFHCPSCKTKWVKGEGWSLLQSMSETNRAG